MGVIEIAQLWASWRAQENYLPLFFENKVQPKCKSREGEEENQYAVEDPTAGEGGPGRPAGSRLLQEPARSSSTSKWKRPFWPGVICSRKGVQTTPPSRGQTAEPEMAASPWTLGLGAGCSTPGRRAPRGVLVDCPVKRTLCPTSVAGVRPDGGHLLPGCDLHPILRQPPLAPGLGG